MKIRIKKGIRVSILAILAILFCVLVLLMSKELSTEELVEEKEQIYTYNQKAEIDYDVFLIPNILYDENSLEKGGTYITAMVDYIDTSMTYNFTGDANANFKGEYEVLAEVKGYTTIDEEDRTIWKKDFILKQKTPFEGEGMSFEVNEKLPLKLSSYSDFSDNIKEETGIISSTRLTLFWNVKLEAEANSRIINEEMVASAIIPLDANYFEITGQLEPSEDGGIDETRHVKSPPDGNLISSYEVGMGILAIAFILMLIFTKAGTKNLLEKRLKKIFRIHKERLAALSGEVSVEEGKGSIVKTIDDLVKIADELGKPIMYRYSDDFIEMTKFYVFDENKTYIFDLEEAIAESEKNDTIDKTDKNDKKNNFLKGKIFKNKKDETLVETVEAKHEPVDEETTGVK